MPSPELFAVHQARELLLGRALAVLAAWALLNLLLSGWLLTRTGRRQPARHFHQMGVAWGLVNACLAAWGILHLHPGPPPALAVLLARQSGDEKLFAFNTGLDVAYVLAGCWLVARAAAMSHARPARSLGFGRALWVQGGFLLVFDALLYFLLQPLGQRLLALVP